MDKPIVDLSFSKENRGRDKAAEGEMNKPRIFILAALVITLFSFGGLGGYTYDAYRTLKETMETDFRLKELAGRILYLDEVLTMSAHMAAVTGDLNWRDRYQA